MASAEQTDRGAKVERLAFAAYLVGALSEAGHEPNRTQLHKAAYLLQSMGGIRHGFPFALHLHGPYSFELDAALSELSAIGWLRADRDASGYGARYSLSKKARAQLPAYLGPWLEREATLRAIGQEVLPRGVPDLELVATAWYVLQELPHAAEDERVQRLRALKPHFPEERIRQSFEEARAMGQRIRAS